MNTEREKLSRQAKRALQKIIETYEEKITKQHNEMQAEIDSLNEQHATTRQQLTARVGALVAQSEADQQRITSLEEEVSTLKNSNRTTTDQHDEKIRKETGD